MAEPKTIRVRDVLKASRGMLQKQLYVAIAKPTWGLGPVMAALEDHLAFIVDAEKKGIVFAAGPLWADDEEHWAGEGMVVLRARSLAHAKRIVAADPMVKRGARTVTVRPWLINEGGFTLKVTFSDGRRVLR